MGKPLQDLIAATSELRSLPSTTLQLMRLLDDVTVEADKVAAVIEKDPSLTANLLKLCNSAYYGVRRKVGSVRDGLILLGNQTLVSLAFATSMGDVLRGPLAAYRLARNDLWHHALGTALGASHLVTLADDRALRERAFTAGLLHDVGKIILNRPLKAAVQQLPRDAGFVELLAAERDILGFDHAEAGAGLAEAWNFPDDLVRTIGEHHAVGGPRDPAHETSRLVAAVAAANLTTVQLGFGGGTVPLADTTYWTTIEELGWETDIVEQLGEQLPGYLDDMLSVIGQERSH